MDEGGAASTLAFLFAGVLFLASVGAVLYSTNDVGTAEKLTGQSAVARSADARALLGFILDSPGFSQYGTQEPVDWVAETPQDQTTKTPDRLQRLGLLATSADLAAAGYFDPGVKAISFAKLENLRRAPHAADGGDGYANYEESRASLGLADKGLDFHIRAHPSLKSVQDLLEQGIKDPNLRVTYIGDASPPSQQAYQTPTASAWSCTAAPSGKALRIETTITNPSANPGMALHGVFTVKFGNNNVVSDTTRAPHVAPAGSTPLWIDVPATSGRNCNTITSNKVEMYNPSASLGTITGPTSFSAVTVSSAQVTFRVDPDRVVYTPGQAVVISYDGGLTPTKNSQVGETVTATVRDADSNAIHTASVQVPKQNDDWVFPAFTPPGIGVYGLELARSNGAVVTDQIIVLSSAPALPTGHTYSDAAKGEIAFLEQLVHRFCPYVWHSTTETPMVTPPADGWGGRCTSPYPYPAHSQAKAGLNQYGDVFPDDKQLLAQKLAPRLEHNKDNQRLDITNTLVVGSNVDHNTMTSEAVKGTIKRWVFAGGTLIVFGSEKQTVQWLQSIFKASIDSASGGIGTPDPNHPMLHVADQLLWLDYNAEGRAWDLKQNGQPNTEITTVVVDGATQNAVLAISDPGAYGDGTVILTSWLPYDIFGGGSGSGGCTENYHACAVINNLLMQGYRDLFLDYGPRIPEGVQAIPAGGVTQVFHPELQDMVAMWVEVFVFPRV